jgi:hypothetical protein
VDEVRLIFAILKEFGRKELPEERRLGENGGIRLTSESDGGGNSR